MHSFLRLLALLLLPHLALAADRPNILWISSEDNGPHLGCYGDTYAVTPHLDALAARGQRFLNVWSVAPVCAPARTAVITGMYPSSIGAEHMRSLVKLPADVRLFPAYLRDAGYWCTNNLKEDYNVDPGGKVWDVSSGKAHWRGRAAGQPFFAVFNFTTTHESQVRKRPHKAVHDPARVPLPPWYPDTPEVRQDWAQYHDNMTRMDTQAGELLEDLKKEGLAEDTIVFYWGDHGPGLPRCKRNASQSGLRVPLIVHFPHKWKHLAPAGYAPGAASPELVCFVDLGPTVLSVAGLSVPPHMQGRAFAGQGRKAAPEYIHGLRGRMDERNDLVRSVRDARYVYVRNFMPHRPQGQRNAYMFVTPTTQVWKRLFDEGKLTPVQSAFWQRKPAEELFDLESDPWETKNLAADPAHAATLQRLRDAATAHALAIRDVDLLPEAEMHRRASAAGGAPRTAGLAASLPLREILDTALQAASGKEEDLPALKTALTHADAAVRYWAVMGFLIRGDKAVQAHAEQLRSMLTDKNATVRLTAAEALAKHGPAEDFTAALNHLANAADLSQNDYFDSVAALNALDELGDRAAPVKERVLKFPKAKPGTGRETGDYVKRLMNHLAGVPTDDK